MALGRHVGRQPGARAGSDKDSIVAWCFIADDDPAVVDYSSIMRTRRRFEPIMISTAMEKLSRFYESDVRLSLKIIATSLATGVLAASPLLLYAAVSAPRSDPGVLGLLAVAGVLLAQLGLAAGLLRLSWELLLE